MGFQSPKVAKPSYTKDVKPTLQVYCFRCHSGPMAKKVDLMAIATDADAKAKIKILKKSLKEIQEGAMPPKGNPQPKPAQVKAFEAWVKTQK